MPFLPLIQVVISRIIVGVVAIATALGLGSVSEPPTPQPHDPIEDSSSVATIEENVPVAPIPNIPAPEESEGNDSTTPQDIEEGLVEDEEPETTPSTEIATEDIPTSDTEIDEILPTTSQDAPLSFSTINIDTKEALVNVFCTQNTATAVTPITGSGVIVDPRGVVVTNAHVAQYFLLKNYPTKNALSCILRSGSPARATYTAELLYIPPVWVSEHASEITESEPTGTGEHDYAFLRITGRTNPSASLPNEFPYVPIDTTSSAIETGDQVLVAAYPAGFISGATVEKDLFRVSSIATVGNRFTFLAQTVDLFSVGGTVVSQGGSSGGAAVSDEGKLIGVIVTTTRAETTAERDLRAISLGHVNRSLTQQENSSVEALLFGDLVVKSTLFNLHTAPALTSLLVNELAK